MSHTTQSPNASSSSVQTHTLSPSAEAATLPPSVPVGTPVPRADGICVPGYEILAALGRGGLGVVATAPQLVQAMAVSGEACVGRVLALAVPACARQMDAAQ